MVGTDIADVNAAQCAKGFNTLNRVMVVGMKAEPLKWPLLPTSFNTLNRVMVVGTKHWRQLC